MRLLPCKNCGDGQAALATKSGILQSAGQMLDPTMTYLCRRCGRTTTISSFEFAQLPLMTPEQIAADTCDITPE
jgi:hypothetical protein